MVSCFTLEVLEAGEGDCLILHYGTSDAPRQILIDGGPRGTYKRTLRKRLVQIGEQLGQLPLELDHIIVTHLDSDHIRGVLDLAEEMSDPDCPAQCDRFWMNTFDEQLLARLAPSARDAHQRTGGASLAGVMASVGEGMALHDQLTRLQAQHNGNLGPLLADRAPMTLPLAPGQFEAQLICPDLRHLQKLAADWQRKAVKSAADLASYLDTSVYNLSSLVMMLRASGEHGQTARMLLTGDARGDHILAGLEHGAMLGDDGRCHVDLLKVPHHGSDRNLEPAFFDRVQAREYVISANGRHHNPSPEVLVWIAQNARHPDYRIWLTNAHNEPDTSLADSIARAKASAPGLGRHLRVRAADRLSFAVDLLAPLAY